MNEETKIELGRRALDEGYRWLGGELTTGGERVWAVGPAGEPRAPALEWAYGGGPIVDTEDLFNPIPDFTDPATFGCLLAQVRERHGAESHVTPASHGTTWMFWAEKQSPDGETLTATYAGYESEVEALVSALEEVPA